MQKQVQGTYAAVAIPRKSDGTIDDPATRSWLRFLVHSGIQGFAINGATGEFTITTEDELHQMLVITAEELRGKANFIVGIGATTDLAAIRLGKIAKDAGALGTLLPMPSFFPYAQEDVISFSRSVAENVDLPILLYNLPQFTTGLAPETSLALIRQCSNIIGIKDSSGSLDTVRLLAQKSPEACRIIGNDGALVPALREGVADGVVSGVACVLPELMQQLFTSGQNAAPDATLTETLQKFITQLETMPTPWGLKVMAEARGIAHASFPFPLSQHRMQQRNELMSWFKQNEQEMCAAAMHA